MNKAIRDLQYNLIGLCNAVHLELGGGLSPIIYHRALAIELTARSMKYQRLKANDIYYRGIAVGRGSAGFLIEELVCLQLSAIKPSKDRQLTLLEQRCDQLNWVFALLVNFDHQAPEISQVFNATHPLMLRSSDVHDYRTSPVIYSVAELNKS